MFKEAWYLVWYVDLQKQIFHEREMSDLGLQTVKKFVRYQVLGEQVIGMRDEVK